LRPARHGYLHVAMDPALDNEHDPMDQDSRTMFPDNGPSKPSWQQTTVPPLGTAAAHPLTGPFPDCLRADADTNVCAAMYEQGRLLAFNSARLPIGIPMSGRFNNSAMRCAAASDASHQDRWPGADEIFGALDARGDGSGEEH
jgi:hypothetical protein